MRKPLCSLLVLLYGMVGLLVSVNCFAAKSADQPQINKAAVRILDYAFPDEYDHYPSSGVEVRVSLDKSKANPAAVGYKLGETHFEWQHNNSMGRQLEWGSDPACPWTLHADWMYLPSGVLVDRQILYNGWEGSYGGEIGIFDQFQGGGDWAGYCNIDITADNRAVVGAHNDIGTTGKYVSTAWWQFGCNQSLFSYIAPLPDSLDECGNTALGSPEGDDYMWPRIAVQDPPDGEAVLHLIGSVFGGGPGQQAFGYFQKVGDNSWGTWTFGCAIDTIPNPEGYALATGPNGEVAIVWQARLAEQPGCDTCSENASSGDIGYDRTNCDLFMQINRNYGRGFLGNPYQPDPGQPNPNWWENRLNITRHAGDEMTGRHNFRPSADMSALFDTRGYFHVAYIGMVWEWPDFGTYRCRTFHWSEDLGFDGDGIPNIRTVATAQWEPNICNPGDYSLNQAKLSISECDDKLYVMWVELNSPNTTGNENHDDCAFRAFEEGGGDRAGAANGDLFVSVSPDWGLTWDFPRNLTDTYGGPTGNPNGACDPAGTAGPCPAEHWPSMASYGTSYAVSLPDPTNVVDIDENPPYSGSHYLDISYMDDLDPGGAVMGEGDWYNTDLLWIRIPCVEPVSAPGFVMTPTVFDYPSCLKHCENEVVEVMVENTGNDMLTLTVTPEEDPSAYSGWLTAPGFPGTLPPGLGNVVIGDVTINAGYTICDPGTVVKVTGRVLFDHNAPSDVDTFFVELIVADTCVLPNWDTIATNCTELTVSNHGRAGNGGSPGGMNLDYFGDHPDNGEWLSADAAANPDVYLYDASTIVGTISDADTMMYWSMYDMTIADSTAIIPLHDTTAQGRIPAHFWETVADGYYTGLYTDADTSIAFEAKWYANTNLAYSCGFVIKETMVYSLDGAPHDSLVLGEVCDWDVPSDSASSDNTSGTGSDFWTPVSNLMYQCGTEWEGFNDEDEDTEGGWDETQRYGAMYFLRGYRYNAAGELTNVWDNPYGMYTASNEKYVYPYELGFHVDSLFKNHAQSGQTVSDSVNTDLHMGMTYLFKYNLAAGDTLYFYTAYMTTMNDIFPTAIGGSGIAWSAVDAMGFFEQYLKHQESPCPYGCGDMDGSYNFDIADLVFLTHFLYLSGAYPADFECTDVDDYDLITVRDMLVYLSYAPARLEMTCPPSHGKLSPPADPTHRVYLGEATYPAGVSSHTVHVMVTNAEHLAAMTIPLRFRIGGQVPSISNIQVSPAFNAAFDGGPFTKINSGEGSVMVSFFSSQSPGLPAGICEMISLTLSVPSSPSARAIDYEFSSFPPLQDGQNVHYPLMVDINMDGITPTAGNDDPSLVAYWKLDEGSGGVAYDATSHDNDGSINNGPVWVDGLTGQALQFDGVDDYIYVPDDASLRPSALTLMAWLKPYQLPPDGHTFGPLVKRTPSWSNDANWQMQVWWTGQVNFSYYNGAWWDSPWSDGTVAVDKWTHLAVTFENRAVKLYIDGQLDSGFPYAMSADLNTAFTSPVIMGKGWVSGQYWGILDEIKIFNRALSDQEILGHFAPSCCDLPGDANNSGTPDISDLTYYVDYMFNGGPGPVCMEEFDNDGNCVPDISDLTYYVDYLFGGGPAPVSCHNCP